MKKAQIRKSSVIRKWNSGKPAVCMRINFTDPVSTELACLSGVDCIWIDMEHCANDWSTIKAHINTAKVYDVDIMIRVPGDPKYEELTKPLELDAAGIMVAHVDSPEQAKKIVDMTKFYPSGMRPIDGGGADAKYRTVPLEEYINTANSEKFIIAMIESEQAVDNIESICKNEGIDGILFGAVDFSQSAGCVGDINRDIVMDAKRKVFDTAKKYRKHIVGGAVIDEYAEIRDAGYDFIVVGNDVDCFKNYCEKVYCKIEDF